MATTISLYNLFGTDIRSRMFINIILQAIKDDASTTLDFTHIRFISRSFADELYTFMNEHKHIHIMGMNEEVKNMYEIVSNSRLQPRKRPTFATKIIDLTTIQEMRAFMSAL